MALPGWTTRGGAPNRRREPAVDVSGAPEGPLTASSDESSRHVSCDIAYSDSPAASRASSRSWKPGRDRTCRPARVPHLPKR